MKINPAPFGISLTLSLLTTIILLIITFPLAIFLGFKKNRIKSALEAFFTLPLVLPPTVLGFYILLMLSPRNAFGIFLEKYFDIRLAFSFPGILIASCIYSFPFMLQPLKNGTESINRSLLEASYTLGKSKIETVFRIILPNIKTFIFTGIVMTFAHTMGEFGVVLMVGGNLPGRTKVASIYIYENVEILNYGEAHIYSIILIAMSFAILLAVNLINFNAKKEII